eukprot:3240179-Rhodomonas_salina.1
MAWVPGLRFRVVGKAGGSTLLWRYCCAQCARYSCSRSSRSALVPPCASRQYHPGTAVRTTSVPLWHHRTLSHSTNLVPPRSLPASPYILRQYSSGRSLSLLVPGTHLGSAQSVPEGQPDVRDIGPLHLISRRS